MLAQNLEVPHRCKRSFKTYSQSLSILGELWRENRIKQIARKGLMSNYEIHERRGYYRDCPGSAIRCEPFTDLFIKSFNQWLGDHNVRAQRSSNIWSMPHAWFLLISTGSGIELNYDGGSRSRTGFEFPVKKAKEESFTCNACARTKWDSWECSQGRKP